MQRAKSASACFSRKRRTSHSVYGNCHSSARRNCSYSSELPCHENGVLLANHLLWLLPEASRNVFERRIDRNSDCTRMGERARCLPGDQPGLASLGSLSVEAARRPWPILIEPTSPRGGKTKWQATVPHVRARLHTVSCASRSVHFPPAVYIKGGAGYIFRPIGG